MNRLFSSKLRCLLVLVGAGCVLCVGIGASRIDTIDSPEEVRRGVEQTRETLSSRYRYPWYDAAQGDLRRMKPARDWNWEWPRWNLSGSGNWMRPLLWTVVIAVGCGLLYLLVRVYLDRRHSLFRRARTHAADSTERSSNRIEELPISVVLSQGDLLTLARSMYERGDFNRAIMYLYSHQLLELDRRHLIRLARGKTNRQYLRELVANSGLQRLLEQSMVAFEEAFFGDHRLSRERFEACWQQLPSFTKTAEQALWQTTTPS